jgi:hypothetical protein
MRNQFFGDNRDLFKYDLIREIINGINNINNFTFIPMLTKNSGQHGNQTDRKKAKAGFQNINLMSYLDNCIKQERRNIIEIKNYFEKEGILIEILQRDRIF